MTQIRLSTEADGPRVLEIWRAAIKATHSFLTPADSADIDREVEQFLPTTSVWLALDNESKPMGFMLLDGPHMEALFIDPLTHGVGLCRALVDHAKALHGAITADVNEQKEHALGFYEHMGFRRSGRSPRDGQGRPYPWVFLRSE